MHLRFARRSTGRLSAVPAILLSLSLLQTAWITFPLSASAAESGRTTARIVMVGDMLMHKYVVDTGERKDLDGNSYWNFDHLFAHVKDEVERADLAIVNQETILGGRELNGFTGYPTFNSPYELADAEVRAGFDVILHGTNHALDRSARGIENCLKYWKSAHPKTLVLVHVTWNCVELVYRVVALVPRTCRAKECQVSAGR